MLSVLRPDGTADAFQYSTDGASTTTIVMTGQPDTSLTNITDGTQTTTITGPVGEMVSRTAIDILSGFTVSQEIYGDYDAYSRPQSVTNLDNTYTHTVYSCCGGQSFTDRDGTVTTYGYDSLKQLLYTTVNGITSSNLWDAAGHIVSTIRIGTNGTLITTSTASYDTAGRMTASADGLGNITRYSETLAPITTTTTYTNGSTRIEANARDGFLMRVSGTAVHGTRNTNDIEVDGGVYRIFNQTKKLDNSGNDTSEWTKTYSDLLGRNYKTLYSDGALSQSFYNGSGQMTKQVDPDGMAMLFQYNAKGEQEYRALAINDTNTVGLASSNRLSRSVSVVTTSVLGNQVRQTQNYVWPTDGADSPILIGVDETTLDGLTSWSSRFGLTNRTDTVYLGGGSRYLTNTAPDGSFSVMTYQNGVLTSAFQYDPSTTQLGGTTYGYDPHGRQNSTIDARVSTESRSYYNNADRVTNVTMIATGLANQSTTTIFDKMGRVTGLVLPDNTTVTSSYWLTGELATNYGSRTYPVGYTYDYSGRKKTMTTWTNFASSAGAAVTTWNYDSNRGFLSSKVYADSRGPSYLYSSAGRLRTNTWARGINKILNYNAAGELAGTTYSDGTTPSVSVVYDRRGRVASVTQGTNSASFTLNDAGQILNESYAGGRLNGLNVTSLYDPWLRRITNGVTDTNGAFITRSTNSYDSASRLQTVSDGTNSARYYYLVNSPLVDHITFASNAVERMVTRKAYDGLNRLTSISSSNSTLGLFSSFAYAYNSASQRTAVTNADNSRSVYLYDSLGQATSGKKYWADGTPVAGQQFEYGFDDIGNRKFAASGGDQWAANLRYENYSVNNLNQYTQRTVPGAISLGPPTPTRLSP